MRHLYALHGFYDTRLGRRTLQSRVSSATLTSYPHSIENLTPADLIRAFLTEQPLTLSTDALRQMPDHYPEELFFVRALTELQDIEETMAVAVSDIDSYDPCTIPGCTHPEKTPLNSPTKLTQSTPKINNQVESYPSQRTINVNFVYYRIPKQRRLVGFRNGGLNDYGFFSRGLLTSVGSTRHVLAQRDFSPSVRA
ncbi:hypothetical protein TNCV_737711 [Trichonephila clavipes]|nr:hypothetical protein TNCV_737711 [Trichonephila clavipes]